MVKKLSQRKTSKLVVEILLDAQERVEGIPRDVLIVLAEDYRRREAEHSARIASQSDDLFSFRSLVAVRGLGDELKNSDIWHHREMDVARWVFAMEVCKRSTDDPGSFVFDKAFSKAQGSNRNGEERKPSLDHQAIKDRATMKRYFDLPTGSREKAKILDSIITETGVYKDHKSTSQESRRRHVKRIIEGK